MVGLVQSAFIPTSNDSKVATGTYQLQLWSAGRGTHDTQVDLLIYVAGRHANFCLIIAVMLSYSGLV